MKPEVGNTVTVIWNRNIGRGKDKISELTITKVGRKWVTIKEERSITRFEIAEVDGYLGPYEIDGGGYSSPGDAFLTAEAATDWLARNRAWSEVHRLLRSIYSPPPGLTLDDLLTLRKKLETSDEA